LNAPFLPAPFEDELLDGYLGRCCAAHCCTNVKSLIAGLGAHLQLPGPYSTQAAIAAGLNITPQQVLFRLTTLPAQRAFAPSHKKDGQRRTEALSSLGVQMRSKVEAMTCAACLNEDRKHGRTSYWRRIHHLPDVDWCPIHREALLKFDPKAFRHRPTDALAQGPGVRLALPTAFDAANILGRYAGLLAHWLQRDFVGSSAALTHVIRDGCTSHELRWTETGRRPLVSDLIARQVPTEWLALHWPDLLTKTPGEYFARLDGPSKDKHVSYPGAACALVLATLFDSVSEILARLEEAESRFVSSPDTVRDGALNAAYLDFINGAKIDTACRTQQVSAEQLEQRNRDEAKRWSRATDGAPRAAPHRRRRSPLPASASVHRPSVAKSSGLEPLSLALAQ